jgi:hypothetical protein
MGKRGGKWTGGFFILPLQGRWLAAGQTEGCPAIVRVTPLHHFVVPLPLQGRILCPQMVASSLPEYLHPMAQPYAP